MQTVLITGGTTGIGYELAKVFASQQFNLVLVARSKEKLLEVGKELKKNYNVKVTVMPEDLSGPKAPFNIHNYLKKKKIGIDVLVNNAGFGSKGYFHDSDITNDLQMIQVNVTALTALSRLILADMVRKGEGKILNVASTAAIQPGPMMAIYHATKAYVLFLSEALAYELKDKNVTITTLCPGPVKTSFQQRAGLDSNYLDKDSRTMDARQVALEGYEALMAGKLVVMPGFMNKFYSFWAKFLPRSFVLKMVKKFQGR